MRQAKLNLSLCEFIPGMVVSPETACYPYLSGYSATVHTPSIRLSVFEVQ